MSWLKIDHCTPDKPEIFSIAAELQISTDEAFGICFRLWRWFDSHTENGNAPSVTLALLDRHLGVTGFAQAALRVGWIEECEIDNKPSMRLPNFDRHNGETAKARALTAKRAAAFRTKSNAKSNAKSNGAGVTSALPREEKRREEKNNKASPVSLEESLESVAKVNPAIADTWRKWIEYRSQKRLKFVKAGLEAAVSEVNNAVSAHGTAAVIAAITKAMASNYQGWHISNGNTNGQHKPAEKPRKYL